jgi:hypothetical protein
LKLTVTGRVVENREKVRKKVREVEKKDGGKNKESGFKVNPNGT